MKYSLIALLSVNIFASGCTGITATQDRPPPEGYNEVRCSSIDGDGRTGSMTQYIKGDATFFKLTLYGEWGVNVTIKCGIEGTSITVNPAEPELPEWISDEGL